MEQLLWTVLFCASLASTKSLWFCQRRTTDTRKALPTNTLPIGTYFPDGAWASLFGVLEPTSTFLCLPYACSRRHFAAHNLHLFKFNQIQSDPQCSIIQPISTRTPHQMVQTTNTTMNTRRQTRMNNEEENKQQPRQQQQ